MKPVILMTVYRRYHELQKNLNLLWNKIAEFRERPEVVVVWSQPEVGRLWFFQQLLAEGKIQRLLGRAQLAYEAQSSTTYSESYNIRYGLEVIKSIYSDCYAIIQAADISPHEGTYGLIDHHMHLDEKAVLFHWQNNCIHHDVWHTNFAAVCLDERYWPPVSDRDNQDTLERQWGIQLCQLELPGVFKSHNYNNKRFLHTHESEFREAWPVYPQIDNVDCGLYISGRKSLWRKVYSLLRRLIWRK